jgi:Type I restriction enzyme HindI endonuclease subunit-like, C-terminal
LVPQVLARRCLEVVFKGTSASTALSVNCAAVGDGATHLTARRRPLVPPHLGIDDNRSRRERKFSEMRERAMRSYTTRSLDAAQVIAELVELAKQMRADRGAKLGLRDDELAFYDAVYQNDSAVLEPRRSVSLTAPRPRRPRQIWCRRRSRQRRSCGVARRRTDNRDSGPGAGRSGPDRE